jgi:outer membrane receptor protein involved in Fe transport
VELEKITNDRIGSNFGATYPLETSRLLEHDRNLIFSHNFVIHPNLVNEFRFGISDCLSDEKFPLNGNSVIQGLGLTGINLDNHPESGAFPILDFSSGTGFSTIGGGKDGPVRSKTYQFVDNVSWIKGRHNFKFGGDIRRIKYTDVQHFGGADDYGQFVFTGLFTGNAFGDLLEGLPTVTYIAVTGPDLVSPAWRYGFYGQDEFQVSKRLTVNFGLRWEFNPPSARAVPSIPIRPDLGRKALVSAKARADSIHAFANASHSRRYTCSTPSESFPRRCLRSSRLCIFRPTIWIWIFTTRNSHPARISTATKSTCNAGTRRQPRRNNRQAKFRSPASVTNIQSIKSKNMSDKYDEEGAHFEND